MRKIDRNWWTLRVVFGLMAIATGLDKFTNIIAQWPNYLADFIPAILNLDAPTFMYLVGVVEILVGVTIFTRYGKLAAYFLSAWLVAISINLVFAGFLDIAARDLGLAVGAFVLANLSPTPEVHKSHRPAVAAA